MSRTVVIPNDSNTSTKFVNVAPSPLSDPVRQPLVGFMTRNNLADQLSWLLSNIALSKPPVLALPPPGENSIPRNSQSFNSNSGGSQSKSSVAISSQTVADRRAVSSNNVISLTGWGEDIVDTPQVIEADDDNMVRLTSTTKSKRPFLISQPYNPLPTPLGTGETGSKSYHGTYNQHIGQSSQLISMIELCLPVIRSEHSESEEAAFATEARCSLRCSFANPQS